MDKAQNLITLTKENLISIIQFAAQDLVVSTDGMQATFTYNEMSEKYSYKSGEITSKL